LARLPTNMTATFQGHRPGFLASHTAEQNRTPMHRNPSTGQGGRRPHRCPPHVDYAVNEHLQLARTTTTAIVTNNT
jgi:hypothetical protein